jgi:ADP-dependent NAD(P)H-hydrate dehydratase
MERITALPDPPARPVDAHKGSFGRVLIVAGSRGMTGAACLAGVAALRAGAGLVTVATPQSVQVVVASFEPSYLTLGLPDDAQGRLSHAALPMVLAALAGQSAAAWGPGLGRSDELDELTHVVYQAASVPMVFDADGLNALAQRRTAFADSPPAGPRILTPHPGEFARLTGRSVEDIAEHREDLVGDFARRHGVIVVLKGAGTVISDGERVAVNTTGNSGLATGGTGDVLTGLLAGLLAQRMEPFAAAQFAVYLHGLAGDLAAAELSPAGMIASDLLKYLPRAWRRMGC